MTGRPHPGGTDRWRASWITDPAFAGLAPIERRMKELEMTKEQPGGPEERYSARHMLVRREFELETLPGEAWLDITADDYYKLYVNGAYVGQGPAQSGFDRYWFNSYEIADLLVAGANCIAVHVYYHGPVSRSYNSADLRQGLIAQLTTDRTPLLGTDRRWRWKTADEFTRGERIGYNTQFAEPIDFRRKAVGWKTAGYDDSAWSEPAEHPGPDYSLHPQPTPVVQTYEVAPRQVSRLGPGHYLLDFGHELTGQLKLAMQGSPGSQVELRCGEELEPGGRVRWEMRCNCAYREVCTLSGGRDELEQYDYKAFRYAEIIAGPGASVDESSFAAVVRHYPYDPDAHRFVASDGRLQAIWDICANAVRYGTQEHYTDCPSREKGQYLGDNTVIMHTHLYLTGDTRMTAKALRDTASTASICPGLIAVTPGHFMQEIADYSLQWPMQIWTHYMHSGDLALLRELLPAVRGMLAHFERYARADGLLEQVADKWNLVDWPDNLRDGYDFSLTKPVGPGCHNLINAFYYGALRHTRMIEAELGADTSGLDAQLAKVRSSFRSAFLLEREQLFADAEGSSHASLHANMLPLLFGMEEEAERPAIVALLRRKRLACGVYMAYLLLQALAAAGEREAVHELIVCEDAHSWQTMLREGATACFEAWSKDSKWNTSLCHPWASAPIPLIVEAVIGLEIVEPGWKKAHLNPRLPAELEAFELELTIATGRLRLRYENGRMDVTAPPGTAIESSSPIVRVLADE
ncbi:family 78 glycoside hydrolase catalytic domain [Paenibacillus sp. IB182496]|uniref:alpha-L-rhamnosidase n=2 Tax=Paenibacillus sabuli TaxID=2772509 RepID=A0A927BSK2_9BACL|nr:family 78 glycoside hydrolase catalytic domain [Paenibacillus sabuli]